jgi:hypothetical protein
MASIGRARCRGAFAAKLFVEELRNGLTVYPYTAETAMLAGWIDEEQTAVATALLEQPPVVAIGSSFSDDLHVKFTLGRQACDPTWAASLQPAPPQPSNPGSMRNKPPSSKSASSSLLKRTSVKTLQTCHRDGQRRMNIGTDLRPRLRRLCRVGVIDIPAAAAVISDQTYVDRLAVRRQPVNSE